MGCKYEEKEKSKNDWVKEEEADKEEKQTDDNVEEQKMRQCVLI